MNLRSRRFRLVCYRARLVPLLYGGQWLAMIPLLAMFGLSAGLKASTAIASPLFNACDRVGLNFRYGVVGVAIFLVSVWVGAARGVEGVAYAVALSSLYALVPFVAALRLVGLGLKDAWGILGVPIISAAVMWIGISTLRPTTSALPIGAFALFALHVGLGALLYVGVLQSLSREYGRDLRELLSRVLPALRGKAGA